MSTIPQPEVSLLPRSSAAPEQAGGGAHVAYIWLVIALLVSAILYDTARWNRSDVLVWDAGGYYLYLPSAFITKDLGQGSFLTYVRGQYRPDLKADYGQIPLPNGRVVFKYPIGMAVLYAPWFGAAHAYARAAGFLPDGYSMPYQRAIALGCAFYGLLGLWLLGRELRHYLPDHLAALTLLVVGLGTNLFNYISVDSPMTHGALFLLNVLLLRFTRQWYAPPAGSRGAGLALALVFGLMLLVRPSELWMAAVPLLWGLTGRTAVQERVAFWLSHWRQVLLMGLVVAALVSVQFIFWRVVGGHWVLDFYPGEKFNLLEPHLWEGLFSVRKGWLFWSPLLTLALVGIGWLRRTVPAALPVVLALVPAVLYITFSWWDWTYGGGFGARTLISLYPLLSLGLAAFWVRWWPRFRVPLAVLVGVLVLLNLRQNWQYTRGTVDCCNEDWAKYKEHFFDH